MYVGFTDSLPHFELLNNNPSRVVSYTIDTFVYDVTFLWVVIN